MTSAGNQSKQTKVREVEVCIGQATLKLKSKFLSTIKELKQIQIANQELVHLAQHLPQDALLPRQLEESPYRSSQGCLTRATLSQD